MVRLNNVLIQVQKKLETVHEDVEGVQLELHALSDNQQETLGLLYEQFAEQVKRELHENKRGAHKNYLVNLIKGIIKGEDILDEELIYLDILGKMSHIDLKVLHKINESKDIDTREIKIGHDISPFLILVSVSNLNSFGLIVKNEISMRTIDSEFMEVSKVALSSFGKYFLEYCMDST